MICISSSVRAPPGPLCALGRSPPPPIEAIELVARATVTPGMPPPPAPPPLPPPPPPTLWFSEALSMPPLNPGVLVVNRARDDDRYAGIKRWHRQRLAEPQR